MRLPEKASATPPDRASALGFVLATGLLFPALLWIFLNRAPLSGDESVYARATLELFRTLAASPIEWVRRSLDILPYKPNGLIWIGQFFVPLGYFLGSLDKGLLLSVWGSQVLTVVVMYLAVLELSKREMTTAVLGGLVVASAPMFVVLGGYYIVESVQILAVAWFILILARVDRWNPPYTLCHLLAASAFACLTKTTTPLFCVWPGLMTLWAIFRRPEGRAGWQWRQARLAPMFAASLGLATVTATWYYRNWGPVIAHTRAASRGPIAAAWGKEDTFLNTLLFWLPELPRSFFYVPVAGLLVACLIVAGVFGRTGKSARFDSAALVAVLQTVTVLGVFSLSANRSSRYLLPLLPCISVALCWSLHRIQNRTLHGLATFGFGVQLVLVYALAYGLLPNRFGTPVRPLDAEGRDAALLKSIVTRSCGDESAARYHNIVAIDPNFRGDWLAPEPASYVAERDLGRGPSTPCDYGYLGRGFFGSSASTAWDALLADGARYVVTTDPAVYAVPGGGFNEALTPDNFRLFWANLTTSGLFAREKPLAEDPGIGVFRRLDLIDHIVAGRGLSDQGKHEPAIEHLNQAALLQPNNAEAWANLALAYERQGNLERAVFAGNKALALSANHYYVNLGLARALIGLRQPVTALERAKHAALNAPGAPERANGLALAARAAFQLRDSAQGCTLLREAADLQPDPAILNELERNTCGR